MSILSDNLGHLRRMCRATASECPKHRQKRRFVERERCHLDHNMNRPRKTTCGAHSAGVYWNRGSNGLNPREGIITYNRSSLKNKEFHGSNGLNPREGIITSLFTYGRTSCFFV